jgi:hypothetical protein
VEFEFFEIQSYSGVKKWTEILLLPESYPENNDYPTPEGLLTLEVTPSIIHLDYLLRRESRLVNRAVSAQLVSYQGLGT